jgi:hypothetical protein
MDNQQDISWDDLMNIIDYSQYNNKIEGDILNEDVKLNDCINNKFSYKRTYNEMMQFSDSNTFNSTISSSNGKKLKLK